MLIIYRTTTGEVVETTGTNTHLPWGPEGDAAWANIPPDQRDGLDLLRLHDVTDADLVAAVVTHHVQVIGGRLVVGDALPAMTPATPGVDLAAWAETAQGEIDAQRRILDLLLLGGLTDGGTLDDAIGDDLPDTGGTLDDLEGLDLTPLPDDGGTLDDLGGLP